MCDFERERLCFEPEDSESESDDSELSYTDLECFFFFWLRSAIDNFESELVDDSDKTHLHSHFLIQKIVLNLPLSYVLSLLIFNFFS